MDFKFILPVNTLEKSGPVKYIKRIPNPNYNGKNDKFLYFYQKDLKNPFKALLEFFGIKKERVDNDFSDQDIRKNYGVTKEQWANHVLEFFLNRDKWVKTFSIKENRERYKKPQQQKEVEARNNTIKKDRGAKSQEKKKGVINRSLMRKIWELYSAEGKQHAQSEKDEKAIEKKIDTGRSATDNEDNGVNDNGNNTESGRIPERIESIRTERGTGSTGDGSGNGRGSGERDDTLLDSGEPGERLGVGEADERIRDAGHGDIHRRLKPKEILKIREECEKLLASKKDDEFTEADKALLRQYAGAGGTNLEGASNAEVLNEYYTPYKVINKVWELVDKYNPRQDKTVLEPSAGIGRFAEGRSEKFTMCELSETTSRINRILHPDARIIQGEFQKNFMRGGMFADGKYDKFDVVIGNPPYGAYSGRAKGKGEGKEHSKIEEYFIDRSLDTLKDGGILAMVVPSSVLRGADTKTKKILESKGELLEAWRLPNGTFDTTDVGTDIIIMRKGKGKPGSLSNDSYFNENPQCIMGNTTQIPDWRNKSKMVEYVSAEGKDIDEILDGISVNAVAVDQKEFEKTDTKIEQGVSYEDKIKAAEDKIKDDFVGRKTEINKDGSKTHTFTDGRVITRDKKGTIVYDSAQGGELKKTDAEKRKNRSDAMKGNKNAEGEHNYPPSAGHIMDASEFSRRYTKKEIDPLEMEVWKLNDYTGKVDPSRLTDELREYVEKSERYVMDGGKYENVVTYASGNIQEKIDNLDPNDIQYDKKKQILEAALPKRKEIDEITLNPLDPFARAFNVSEDEEDEGVRYRIDRNHSFMCKGLILEFFRWARLGMYNSPVGKYDIPEDCKPEDIVKYIMGQNSLLTKYDEPDEQLRAVKNMKLKNARAKTAQELFNRFLREGLGPDTQKRLVDEWNKKFNATVNPDYSEMPVFVNGMSTHKGSKEFDLLEQQVKGVSFLASKGSGLLAYDVGVGKTVTGIVATVNQIQTGRAKRPLICVPASVYEKWIKEIKQHFPEQEVIPLGNLGKDSFDAETHEAIIRDKKTKTVTRKKIQDGALLVCTYEGLENIGFTEESENEIYEDVEFATDNPFKKENKRQKAQSSERADETVGQMTRTKGKNDVLIEELGIDHITVDEIHNFNHVFASPRVFGSNDKDDEMGKANEYSGMGGRVSDMGQKMFAITQYIQRHNDNRNVYGLSATPFTNKPAEVYSILSLIARKRMRELGIKSLQDFMRKFADITMEYVVKPKNKRKDGSDDMDGGMTVKQENVMKGFQNLGVLQSFIKEYIDKVDGEEAKVIRPHKVTKTPMLEKSELQEKLLNYELERMSEVSKDNPGAAIVAMTNMRQILLSPSFVSEDLKKEYADELGIDISELDAKNCVENSPKLKFCCDAIVKQYKNNTKNGQFIYVPRGVNNHKFIKEYLVKHGIPAEAIELLGNEEGSVDKRLKEKQRKVDDFNNPDGTIKVVIGNESTKEGVSLNGNTTTVYNTMLGWNPTEATQVEGRVWRQGNKQGVTSVVYPLIYDSLDARLYQLYEEKKGRIDSIFSYKGDELNVEDVKADEMKFALIKDPKVKAGLEVDQMKTEIDTEIRLNDSRRDKLHEAKSFFSEDVKDSYSYKSYVENKERYEKWAEEGQAKLEEAQKYVKKLKSKDADEKELAEFKIKKLLAMYRDPTPENVEAEIKSFKENIKDNKKKAAAYEKEANKLVYQYERRKEALAKDGLTSKEDVENKINELTERKKELTERKDHLEQEKERLTAKYQKMLMMEKMVMPTIEEQVETTVNSIISTLRPMDEVKSWVTEMRAQGMSNQAIKEEIDLRVNGAGVKKGGLYIKGNRFYMSKSALVRLQEELE